MSKTPLRKVKACESSDENSSDMDEFFNKISASKINTDSSDDESDVEDVVRFIKKTSGNKQVHQTITWKFWINRFVLLSTVIPRLPEDGVLPDRNSFQFWTLIRPTIKSNRMKNQDTLHFPRMSVSDDTNVFSSEWHQQLKFTTTSSERCWLEYLV